VRTFIRKLSGNEDKAYIIALVLISLVLLLVLEITEPFYFSYDDNSVQFLSFYSFNYRSVTESGRIPLINFHQFCGVNHIGEGQTAVFYIPAYVAACISKLLFHSLWQTVDILVFMHLILSAVFMFLLLRKLSVSREAGFLGALVWMTFPFGIFLSKSWVFVAYTACFIPLCFLALHMFLEKPAVDTVLLLALCRTFFCLQGYVQYVHMELILEGLYVIMVLMVKKRGRIVPLLAGYLSSILCTAFLCAPQLLPILKAKKLSFWRASNLSYDYAIFFALSLRDFLAAQFFKFRDNVFGCASSQIYYTGIFVYLIFFFPLKKSIRDALKGSNLPFFIILALISLLFSTHLYGLFYRIIPGFSFFKGQFKHFIFYLFFLVLSVSMIADRAMATERRLLRGGALSLLILTIVSNCLILSNHREIILGKSRMGPFPGDFVSIFSGRTAGRVFTYNCADVPAEEQYKYLSFNSATLLDLYHFRGYPLPLISSLTVKYCRSIGSQEKELSRELIVYLSFWGVRYFVMTDTPLHRKEAEAFPQLEMRYAADNILVYENMKALPLVFFKDKIRQEVPFHFGTNEVTIYPRRPEGGEMIIGLIPIEGYTCYFDGSRAGTIKVDEIPVSISLPPGVKQVVIKYSDDSFIKGMLLFICFILIAAGYFVRSLFVKKARQDMKEKLNL
jgi:hypothetical protein